MKLDRRLVGNHLLILNGDETESGDTSAYDSLVNEVLDTISAQIDDIIGNYTSDGDEEGDDS